MDWAAHEGLHLALRWFHVAAVITWIGHAYFFNWLDRSLEPRARPAGGGPGDVEGELWMVHSGGFYRVEKIAVAPRRLPGVLHWFRWEAALSWLSGFLLLLAVYYAGGGALLLDPAVDLPPAAVMAIGLGSLAAGWLLYDQVFCRWIAGGPLSVPVGYALIVAAGWWLGRIMSGRAAYIHVGAVLGTLMVASVWLRIVPAQRELVAASREGRAPDARLGAAAKQRSVHNNHLSLPVVFTMIGNHFFGTYGHERAWLVLALLVAAGLGVRRLMNAGPARAPAAAAAVLVAVAGAAWVQRAPPPAAGAPPAARAPAAAEDEEPLGVRAAATHGGGAARAPRGTGTVRGHVRLAGAPPPPRSLTLTGECHEVRGSATVPARDVLVREGRLQNAFVRLLDVDGVPVPPAPGREVVLDQQGCTFTPRVVGIRPGQPLVLANGDPVLHNVHAMPEANAGFNLALPSRGARAVRTFRRPEVMVPVQCDVHPWMGAWVGVVDHPWFAVTDTDGAFVLAEVPEGTYRLEAWHEVFGTVRTSVTVPAGGTAQTTLALDAGG